MALVNVAICALTDVFFIVISFHVIPYSTVILYCSFLFKCFTNIFFKVVFYHLPRRTDETHWPPSNEHWCHHLTVYTVNISENANYTYSYLLFLVQSPLAYSPLDQTRHLSTTEDTEVMAPIFFLQV